MLENLPQLAQLSGHTEQLTIELREATAEVRHEDREDIAVFSNNASHWLVADGAIRQTAVTPVIVEVFNFPITRRSTTTVTHREIGFLDLMVMLWHKIIGRVPVTSAEVEPPQPVQESAPEPTPPVTSAPATPKLEADKLLVLVPLGYAGDIKATNNGRKSLAIDHWSGGAFDLTVSGDGDFTMGDIDGRSFSATLYGGGSHQFGDIHCPGDVDFNQSGNVDLTVGTVRGQNVGGNFAGAYGVVLGNVEASATADLNRSGDGSFTVGDVTAATIGMTFKGDGSHKVGDLTAEGDVGLDQEGNCDVTILDIVCDNFSVQADGEYAFELGDITAGDAVSCNRYNNGNLVVGNIKAGGDITFDLNGDGTHTIGDCVSGGEVKVEQEDSSEVTLGDLSGRTAYVEFNGDYGQNVGRITAADRVDVNRYGDGDLAVAGIHCGPNDDFEEGAGVVDLLIQSNGGINLGDVTGGLVKLVHDEGDSGLDLGTVKAQCFEFGHASDGEVDIQVLDAESIDIRTDGCGDVTIYGGSAARGSVYNEGDLKLSLTGRFAYISHDNDGDGRLKIAIVE